MTAQNHPKPAFYSIVIPAQAGIHDGLWFYSQRMLSPVCVHHLSRAIMQQAAVYMLASQRNGTLYIGVTSDLIKRIWQHKNEQLDGFTKKYGVRFLLYYELHQEMLTAIAREKQLKKWNRAWKLALIEKKNLQWRDLWEDIIA